VTEQTGWQLTEELVLAIQLSRDSVARYFRSSS
jgi:hypothetical protein